MIRAPIMAENLRKLRKTVDFTNLKEDMLWALWLIKLKGVMRGSNILIRPRGEKKEMETFARYPYGKT